MNRRSNIIPTSPRHIDPAHILDGQAALIAAARRVDARGDVDGLVDVLGADVGEGDVAHEPVAAVGLDPGCVGAVRAGDVVEGHVLHEVWRVAGVVAQRADGRAAGLVAVHVGDLDVGAVAFDGYAVLWVG